jgi:hypothetical protein
VESVAASKRDVVGNRVKQPLEGKMAKRQKYHWYG